MEDVKDYMEYAPTAGTTWGAPARGICDWCVAQLCITSNVYEAAIINTKTILWNLYKYLN